MTFNEPLADDLRAAIVEWLETHSGHPDVIPTIYSVCLHMAAANVAATLTNDPDEAAKIADDLCFTWIESTHDKTEEESGNLSGRAGRAE